ncbi:MAG TPA: hypothetical protein VF152_01430 [Acidimicrobiia bacterium]
MQIKRSVAVLALSGSALAGGVLFGPVLAGAQEDGQQDGQQDGQEQPAPEEGPGGPCRGPGGGKHLEVAAGAIGIEVDALREALEGGQTMAQVAEANGVDVQTVVDALVADISARIDEGVAEGRLTQEEADAKKAELQERVTARVNGERPEGAPEGPRGPQGEAPESDESTETSASA